MPGEDKTMEILVMDGVKYGLWEPKFEDEFAQLVKEHIYDIFGKEVMFFDLEKKLKSKSGIASIPDGYIIDPNKNQWYIVEIEISSHNLYDHIFPQISKFSKGIENPASQKEIISALYREIDEGAVKKIKDIIGSGEIHKFLSDLVSEKPVLAIIIDRKTAELEEVCSNFRFETEVIEFKTFIREGVGLPVHIHLFEPLTIEERLPEKISISQPKKTKRRKKGILVPQREYRIPILESLLEMGGRTEVKDVLKKVEQKMKDKFTQAEYEKHRSGEITWKNRTLFERLKMRNEGLLKKESPWGTWEITSKGQEFYEKEK